MAIQYKISEVGIQKIVEILEDGNVIGKRKFIAREIITVTDNSTVQLKDSSTNEVLFSGSSSQFLNADGETFGNTPEEVASAVNDKLSKLNISFEDLDNVDVVEGGINLSNYATVDSLNTYKSEVETSLTELSATVDSSISELNNTITTNVDEINSTIDTSVEQHLAIKILSKTISVAKHSVAASRDTSITFTVPDNGKFRIIYEAINAEINTAVTLYGHLSTVDPGETDIAFTQIDDPRYTTGDYLDDTIGNGTNYNTNTYFDRLTFVRHPEINDIAFPKIVRNTVVGEFSKFKDDTPLVPGEEITVHLWLEAGAYGIDAAAIVDFYKILVVELPD